MSGSLIARLDHSGDDHIDGDDHCDGDDHDG